MSKAVLHLMHKDEVMIKLEKDLSLLSHLNKNPEANKYLIPKLQGSIDALKWVLGFDYIEQNQEEEHDNTNE